MSAHPPAPIGVIVAVDRDHEPTVTARLSEAPDFTLVRRPADEVELLAAASAGMGAVVVLGREFPGLDAEVVRRLHGTGARLLGLGDDEEQFRAWGVRSHVSPWDPPEVFLAAVRDCAQSLAVPPRPAAPPQAAQTREPGPVIAVWGTGSAPGRSTVAAGLAHLLSSHGTSVVLIDADTVTAGQAAMLGIVDDAPQLAALCRRAASGVLTPELFSRHLTAISPRLHLVTGLSRASRWPEVRPALLSTILDAAAATADAVIVDIADRIDPDDEFADPHYDRHAATRAVLERADHTLLIAQADPLGIQRLVRLLETERGEALRDGATIVMNKARASAVGADPQTVIDATLSRFLGLGGCHYLPDDRTNVDAAVLAGQAITEHAPRSPLSRALGELAAALPGLPEPQLRRRDRSSKPTAARRVRLPRLRRRTMTT